MIDAGGIAKVLSGRRSGIGWICKCVAHEDHSPSLSIADGNDGRILVKCFSGCHPRDIIAELDRRGLWPGREQDRPRDGNTAINAADQTRPGQADTTGTRVDGAKRSQSPARWRADT